MSLEVSHFNFKVFRAKKTFIVITVEIGRDNSQIYIQKNNIVNIVNLVDTKLNVERDSKEDNINLIWVKKDFRRVDKSSI